MPLYRPITGSSVVDGTLSELDLDASVQASLGLADSATQAADLTAAIEAERTSERAHQSDTYVPLASRKTVDLAMLPGHLWNVRVQNAPAWAQDNVTTVDGVQYAVWVDSRRRPMIGKRTFPGGAWSTFDLSTVTGNPLASPVYDDTHNNIAVAVDSTGVIHVAGNMHAQALRYVRSSNPNDITAWASASMIGTEETAVTYPQFVTLTDGTLLFFHRTGVSGNGDQIIDRYNTGTQTWARVSTLMRGTTPTSPDESPYINHVAVSTTGVIHVFYMWRLTSDVSTSHDISHVKSTDGGTTWTTQAGAAVSLPITPATAGVVVIADNPGELINQSGASVDAAGRPHAAWWLRNGGTGRPELHHIWHDGADWQNDIVATVPRSVALLGNVTRPAVLCTSAGRTFVLYTLDRLPERASVRMLDVTPTATATPLPECSIADLDIASGEITYDTRAVADDWLHILLTPCQSENDLGTYDDAFAGQWGGVLSVDLRQVDQLAAGQVELPRIQVLASASGGSVSASTLTTASLAGTVAVDSTPAAYVARSLTAAAQSAGTALAGPAQRPAAGTATARVGGVTVTSTTRSVRQTPWVPVRQDLQDTSAGALVEAKGAPVGGTLAAAASTVTVGRIVQGGRPVAYTATRGFDPTRFGKLAAWFRATDLSSDGSAVASWTDASGNSRHATQGTGSAQPTYRATGINSLPAVEFDGGDLLSSVAFVLGRQSTIIAVAASTGSGADQQIVASDDSGTATTRIFQFSYDATPTTFKTVAFGAGTGIVTKTATISDPTAAKVFAVTRYSDDLLSTCSVRSWVNGADQGSQAGTGYSWYGTSATKVHLGGRRTSNDTASTNLLTGHIGEVLVFTESLLTAERQAVEAYLADKFAITLA